MSVNVISIPPIRPTIISSFPALGQTLQNDVLSNSDLVTQMAGPVHLPNSWMTVTGSTTLQSTVSIVAGVNDQFTIKCAPWIMATAKAMQPGMTKRSVPPPNAAFQSTWPTGVPDQSIPFQAQINTPVAVQDYLYNYVVNTQPVGTDSIQCSGSPYYQSTAMNNLNNYNMVSFLSDKNSCLIQVGETNNLAAGDPIGYRPLLDLGAMTDPPPFTAMYPSPNVNFAISASKCDTFDIFRTDHVTQYNTNNFCVLDDTWVQAGKPNPDALNFQVVGVQTIDNFLSFNQIAKSYGSDWFHTCSYTNTQGEAAAFTGVTNVKPDYTATVGQFTYDTQWTNKVFNNTNIGDSGTNLRPQAANLGTTTTLFRANSTLAHQPNAFVRAIFFIIDDTLAMAANTSSDNPFIFPINCSPESAMNSSLTNPGKTFQVKIGHTYLPFLNGGGNMFSAFWPTPCQAVTKNAPCSRTTSGTRNSSFCHPSKTLRGNPNSAKGDGTKGVFQTGNFFDGVLQAQVNFGTIDFPKNGYVQPLTRQLFFNMQVMQANDTSSDPTNNFISPCVQWFPEGYTTECRFVYTYRPAFMFKDAGGVYGNQFNGKFTEMLTWTTTVKIPAGNYLLDKLVEVVNEAVNRPDANGNYPLYQRISPGELGTSMILTSSDMQEDRVPWTAANSQCQELNPKGNRTGPSSAGHQGRGCMAFQGPASDFFAGAAEFTFSYNATTSRIQFQNTSTLYAPIATTTTQLRAGISSAFAAFASFNRGPNDPILVGNGGQLTVVSTTGGSSTPSQPDPIFLQNNVTMYPLLPSNTSTSISNTVDLTSYGAGASDLGSNSAGQAQLGISATGINNTWQLTKTADGDNNATPFFLNFCSLGTSFDVADMFQSALDGFVTLNPYGSGNYVGSTGVMLMSMCDSKNPTEVAFWTTLGYDAGALSKMWDPEFRYVKPIEGAYYDFHTESLQFDKSAFCVSNENPELATHMPMWAFTSSPYYNPSTFATNTAAQLQAFINTLPLYNVEISANENVTALTPCGGLSSISSSIFPADVFSGFPQWTINNYIPTTPPPSQNTWPEFWVQFDVGNALWNDPNSDIFGQNRNYYVGLAALSNNARGTPNEPSTLLYPIDPTYLVANQAKATSGAVNICALTLFAANPYNMHGSSVSNCYPGIDMFPSTMTCVGTSTVWEQPALNMYPPTIGQWTGGNWARPSGEAGTLSSLRGSEFLQGSCVMQAGYTSYVQDFYDNFASLPDNGYIPLVEVCNNSSRGVPSPWCDPSTFGNFSTYVTGNNVYRSPEFLTRFMTLADQFKMAVPFYTGFTGANRPTISYYSGYCEYVDPRYYNLFGYNLSTSYLDGLINWHNMWSGTGTDPSPPTWFSFIQAHAGNYGMTSPMAGRIHCDQIAPYYFNCAPCSTYRGLTTGIPTKSELMMNQSLKGEWQNELNQIGHESDVLCFVVNATYNNPASSVFNTKYQIPILTGTDFYPPSDFSQLGQCSPQSLVGTGQNTTGTDLSEPIQIPTPTANPTLGDGVLNPLEFLAAGILNLRVRGVQFNPGCFAVVQGRINGDYIPMSFVQSSITQNIVSFTSEVTWNIPEQYVDYLEFAFFDVDNKPVTNLTNVRIILTFTLTASPTQAEQALANQQTVEQVQAGVPVATGSDGPNSFAVQTGSGLIHWRVMM